MGNISSDSHSARLVELPPDTAAEGSTSSESDGARSTKVPRARSPMASVLCGIVQILNKQMAMAVEAIYTQAKGGNTMIFHT